MSGRTLNLLLSAYPSYIGVSGFVGTQLQAPGLL